MSGDGIKGFERSHVPYSDGIVGSTSGDLISGRSERRVDALDSEKKNKAGEGIETYPFGENDIESMP